MSPRAEAVLTTKPPSTVKETCVRAVALTRCCYLALYRVTRTEPCWRGVKLPCWVNYQSVSFEVRLYAHHAAREHQRLYRCENDRNKGGTLAKEEFNRWRDLLLQLAQKDADRLQSWVSEAFSGAQHPAPAPIEPAPTPLEAAAARAARALGECDGCGGSFRDCQPLWSELRKCCPDCTHDHGAELAELAGIDLGVRHRLVGREALDFEVKPAPMSEERRLDIQAALNAEFDAFAAKHPELARDAAAELFATGPAVSGHTDNCTFWLGEAGRPVGSGPRCSCGLDDAGKRIDAALAVRSLLSEGGSR